MDAVMQLWEMFKTTGQLLWNLWFVWIVPVAVFVIKVATQFYRSHRLARAGMSQIDKMSGKEFENYLEILFKKLGYKVKRTPYRGDYGADLVIEKDSEQTVVQAKRYKRNVGLKAVQEAVAAKAYYNGLKAMVVTNSYYSKQAIKLAKTNQVKLWNRHDLAKAVLSVQKGTSAKPKQTAIPQTNTTPQKQSPATLDPNRCATCGQPVSAKIKRYCLSRPALFGGQVYCYRHQQPFKQRAD